jgi:hypothetical protein
MKPAGIDIAEGLRWALARRNMAYRRRLLERRRQPPRCKRGWEIGAPDYVGVGVEKAGTSWWWWLIRRHPDVAEPGRTKEISFLQHLDADGLDEAAVLAYHRFFPRPPGTLVGEWTPNYNELPQLPLLGRLAPDASLLMMVRDPIERYRSGIAMRTRYRMGDPRSVEFEERAVERGMYASSLDRVRGALPRHKLLVLQYERCVLDPATELARTYRFLGLDEGFRPTWAKHRVNRTPGDRPPVSAATRRRLVELYAPDVARLARIAPEIDLELWPDFGARARG